MAAPSARSRHRAESGEPATSPRAPDAPVELAAQDAVKAAEDEVALLHARFDVRRAELDASTNELIAAIQAQQTRKVRHTLGRKQRLALSPVTGPSVLLGPDGKPVSTTSGDVTAQASQPEPAANAGGSSAGDSRGPTAAIGPHSVVSLRGNNPAALSGQADEAGPVNSNPRRKFQTETPPEIAMPG